jgi:hypothetical protein
LAEILIQLKRDVPKAPQNENHGVPSLRKILVNQPEKLPRNAAA